MSSTHPAPANTTAAAAAASSSSLGPEVGTTITIPPTGKNVDMHHNFVDNWLSLLLLLDPHLLRRQMTMMNGRQVWNAPSRMTVVFVKMMMRTWTTLGERRKSGTKTSRIHKNTIVNKCSCKKSTSSSTVFATEMNLMPKPTP